jgi:erythromycin esterase-like protein
MLTGKARGTLVPGGVVGSIQWRRTHTGALIQPDGMLRACVPRALYSIEVTHRTSDGVLLTPPGDAEVQGYSRQEIEAVAPVALLQSETSILDVIPSVAKIVGIGEPNHGARETLSARMEGCLELAKRDMPVAIALEAGEAEVRPLNEFVHGKGTEAALRASVSALGYWIWDTEDFLATLVALRDHNRNVATERQVSLFGVDVQLQQRGAALLEAVAREREWPEDAVLGMVATGTSLENVDARRAAGLRSWLETYPLQRGVASTRLMAAALRAQIDAVGKTGVRKQVARDRDMASLVSVLASSWNGKICLLAHNDHIT